MRDARSNGWMDDKVIMMDKWMGVWMMDGLNNRHTCHRLRPGA